MICGKYSDNLGASAVSRHVTWPQAYVTYCMDDDHCKLSAIASVENFHSQLGYFIYDSEPEEAFKLLQSSGAIEDGFHIEFIKKSKSRANTYLLRMSGTVTKDVSLADFVKANPEVDIMMIMPKISLYYPEDKAEDMKQAFLVHSKKI